MVWNKVSSKKNYNSKYVRRWFVAQFFGCLVWLLPSDCRFKFCSTIPLVVVCSVNAFPTKPQSVVAYTTALIFSSCSETQIVYIHHSRRTVYSSTIDSRATCFVFSGLLRWQRCALMGVMHRLNTANLLPLRLSWASDAKARCAATDTLLHAACC